MASVRRASRRRYVLFVIVLTAITLITLDTRNGRSGPVGALGRGAHTVVGPVSDGVDSLTRPISDWWDGVWSSGDIKKQNRALRQQVQELQGQQRQAQQAIDHDRDLEAMLQLRSTYNVKQVPARIVGRDPGNFSSTLEIDHGTESGIAKDMPVVAPDGSLVGTVIEATRNYATIRVLTDPEFAVGVKFPAHAPAGATTGIAHGQRFSHELLDDDIDAQQKVVGGDLVVTAPSPASLYPPDIPVGVVSRVDAQPGGLPQHVFIKPHVDFGALEYVSVLIWVQGQQPVVVTTTTTAPSTSMTTTTVPGA
jgi:rod shape-determining protein MreC